jgi:hypothetical protein
LQKFRFSSGDLSIPVFDLTGADEVNDSAKVLLLAKNKEPSGVILASLLLLGRRIIAGLVGSALTGRIYEIPHLPWSRRASCSADCVQSAASTVAERQALPPVVDRFFRRSSRAWPASASSVWMTRWSSSGL